jgi:hypothetical protein
MIMKRNSTPGQILIILAIVLTGCAVSNSRFFASVEPAADPTYGYTAENPVPIKSGDLGRSIGSSYYYLSRLRTDCGNKLQLIMRFSIPNPDYQKGPLLDLYMLHPENELDTIRIYVNPYFKGEIKAPHGLKFVQE